MINIKRTAHDIAIHSSVSDFTGAMGYCEHQIPFYIEGIKPQTPVMVQGTDSHKKVEIREKTEAEFQPEEERPRLPPTASEEMRQEYVHMQPVTTAELEDVAKPVEFARETLLTRLEIPFAIKDDNVRVILYGKSDKITRDNETLLVSDDKFPSRPESYAARDEPYTGQKLQLLVYLNSLYSKDGNYGGSDYFDIPHKQKEWELVIKNKYDGGRILKTFRKAQDTADLAFLHGHLERYAMLVLETESPRHHNYASKCRPCKFKDMCSFNLDAPQSGSKNSSPPASST